MALDWRDQRIAQTEGQQHEAQAANAALKVRAAQLEERVAELERAVKRRAVPFARKEHKGPSEKAGT